MIRLVPQEYKLLKQLLLKFEMVRSGYSQKVVFAKSLS